MSCMPSRKPLAGVSVCIVPAVNTDSAAPHARILCNIVAPRTGVRPTAQILGNDTTLARAPTDSPLALLGRGAPLLCASDIGARCSKLILRQHGFVVDHRDPRRPLVAGVDFLRNQ